MSGATDANVTTARPRRSSGKLVANTQPVKKCVTGLTGSQIPRHPLAAVGAQDDRLRKQLDVNQHVAVFDFDGIHIDL
jgi:hypothetical protein